MNRTTHDIIEIFSLLASLHRRLLVRRAIFRFAGTFIYSQMSNVLSDHPQNARSKQCYRMRSALCKTFVATLVKTKQIFDCLEGIFQLGAGNGLKLLSLAEQVTPNNSTCEPWH